MLAALGVHQHRVGLVPDHPEDLAGAVAAAGRQWLAIGVDQEGRSILSAQVQFGFGRHGAVADRRQRRTEYCAIGFRRQQGVDRTARQFVRRGATEFGHTPVAAKDTATFGEQDSGERIVDQRALLGVERVEIA